MSEPKWMADLRAKAALYADQRASSGVENLALCQEWATVCTPQTALWLLDMLNDTIGYMEEGHDYERFGAGPGGDTPTDAYKPSEEALARRERWDTPGAGPVVLTEQGFDSFLERLESDEPPSQALIDLMKGPGGDK